jgi:hypothetical protein
LLDSPPNALELFPVEVAFVFSRKLAKITKIHLLLVYVLVLVHKIKSCFRPILKQWVMQRLVKSLVFPLKEFLNDSVYVSAPPLAKLLLLEANPSYKLHFLDDEFGDLLSGCVLNLV